MACKQLLPVLLLHGDITQPPPLHEFDITFCRTNTQSNEVEIQRIEHSDITKKTEARGDDVIDDANDDDKAVSDEVKEHEMSTCPAAHDTQK